MFRQLLIGLLVAAVAVVAFTAGMGLVVSSHFDSSGRVRTEATPAVVGSAPAGVPVLCYHYLRDKSDPLRLLRVFGYVVLSLPLLNDTELWTTGASEFEHQMQLLKDMGYHAVTLDELHEWQTGRRELPGKPIVITFDDGDQSVYDLALPILARHGFRATLFVITARVGTKWNGIDCLDWARLRELEESGVFRIESHTDDLHYKVEAGDRTEPVFIAASEHGTDLDGSRDWERKVREDLARSRAAIERNTGRSPRFLAWPYGAANANLNRIAAEEGFVRTCSLRAKRNQRVFATASNTAPPAEISRYTITARTSLRAFKSILDGTFEPRT
jgi:peptidoglycan/xylan/chitin deacetylase (PgdA/CDA1 family)